MPQLLNNTLELIELYLATFNRAPDTDGLNYWLNEMEYNGWSLEDVAQSFFEQPETQEMYPEALDAVDFINAAYNNVLGRDADADGLAYWVNELENGSISRDDFIIAVINGAKDNQTPQGILDAQLLENKANVGNMFVELGINDVDLAHEMISRVTDDDASVTEIEEELATYSDADDVVDNNDETEVEEADDTVDNEINMEEADDIVEDATDDVVDNNDETEVEEADDAVDNEINMEEADDIVEDATDDDETDVEDAQVEYASFSWESGNTQSSAGQDDDVSPDLLGIAPVSYDLY